MRILVVGGGGREHAIIKKIKENKNVSEIFALPGNGGIAEDATCVDIDAEDLSGIAKFAGENKIDFTVVAHDDPLDPVGPSPTASGNRSPHRGVMMAVRAGAGRQGRRRYARRQIGRASCRERV